MLYRVLCFALVCATSAHAAAIAPPSRGDALSTDEAGLAELLYGFRYTAEDVPHPMNASRGNLMWDASGTGCVDGGGWSDPFPGQKGDLREPVFCIPQPCVALLMPEELSREVYGRALREGEYETYLDRLEDFCEELPTAAAFDEAGLGFLHFVSYEPGSLPPVDVYEPLDPWMPAAFVASVGGSGLWIGGALTPTDLRANPRRSDLAAAPGRTTYPAFRSTGRGSRPGSGGRRPTTGGGSGGSGGGSGPTGPQPDFVTQFTPKPSVGP
jgi:hypothetical protein